MARWLVVAKTFVPDTSVLVDGRLTELIRSDGLEGGSKGARVVVPMAALAELEAQANRGLESGVAGLDELAALQQLAKDGRIDVEFVGNRPSPAEIEHADRGAIDAIIRDVAVGSDATFVTSDRVQAHAAAAQGIRHLYLRPIVRAAADFTALRLWEFFDPETMSVHLKADCVPMAKRGKPGAVSYVPAATKAMAHTELRAIVRECIEFAKRDYNSFMEMEKHGCTVIQLGPMRITIAQPPFSDGLELTAVRPITKKSIEHYKLSRDIFERIEGKSRGVFVAGPPGSGKSTFAAAVAEHLHGLARVVKTMEQPRDLQVPKEVTQYGALDKDMKWTGDVILLVRPDHVLYDEVRTTEDFVTFADMRLAGVGLIGVTHANRAIDAVQRLIGRVELGMIPQVVDTVLFVDAGEIATTLELEFTVKVPEGMTMEDLARPVVVVRDVEREIPVYELYTYGEQIVVMPLEGAGSPGRRSSSSNPAAALAEKQLVATLRRNVQGPLEVEVRGGKATVMVDPSEVAQLIGKGGRTVQMLERKLGIRLDIKAMAGVPKKASRRNQSYAPWQERPGTLGVEESTEDPDADGSHGGHGARALRGADAVPAVRVKPTGTNVFLLVDDARGGATYRVTVEGAVVGEAVASQQGRLRFKKDSPEGMAILKAHKSGYTFDVEEA